MRDKGLLNQAGEGGWATVGTYDRCAQCTKNARMHKVHNSTESVEKVEWGDWRGTKYWYPNVVRLKLIEAGHRTAIGCPDRDNDYPGGSSLSILESQFWSYCSHTTRHWGQGPKYPLGTWWKHWDRSQHATQICPVIKCWVHFKYTLLCDPDMPSGHILSTFWMYPAIWLQCTQWPNNWVHFQYSQKSDPNMPSG